MDRVGITVVGKDKEGIVAAFTNYVFAKKGNIESVNQNVIQGLFGMYVEATFQEMDTESFDAGLYHIASEVGMDVNVYHVTGSENKIAVLVTKESHCLEAILGATTDGHIRGSIPVIIGTQDTLKPLADKAGIPFVTVSERDQEKAEKDILALCRRFEINLIVLARYMRILTPNFVWRYPKRIINIHPSLLPAFPGAYAYMQAFERGTKIIGVTSHYVTENLDQGPIIIQESFKVDADDTLEMIKAKGQRLEAETLTNAIRLHLDNRLEIRWRKVHIRSR